MSAFFTIDGLEKSFGPKQVLRGVGLTVARGESLVIIGGSGSGKSVTLKCILGLVRADRGSIRLDGTELVGASGRTLEEARGRFGMLFQNGALFDSLPVWQNVTFALTRGRTGRKAEMRALAIELLAKVDLEPRVADLLPASLSGGMQKRVGLARAIAARPDMLLFDEPTAGLDPIRSNVINALIRDQVTALGATAITITHDMESARFIADRIAMLHEGRILWEGSVEQLERSGNPYVEQFVHGGRKNPIGTATNG